MTSASDQTDSEPVEPTTVTPPQETSFRLSNASVRYLTAVIVLPLVILDTYVGGIIWEVSIAIIAMIGGAEYYLMAHGRDSQGSIIIGVPMILSVIIGFHFKEPLIWIISLMVGSLATFVLEYLRHPNNLRQALIQVLTTLGGVAYIGFPLAFAVAIRNIPETGLAWILVVFASTWGTDSFAYFGGRLFGKTPLVPKLSPKKTREGAIAGIIGGVIPAFIFVATLLEITPGVLLVLVLAPFVAIAGDLFESGIKRYFGVKDSHLAGLNILPGHGGILDRIDALLWVLVLYYLFLLMSGIL